MKKKELKEIRELSDADLKSKIEEFKKDIYKYRCEYQVYKKRDKAHLLRAAKKGIATLKTILRSRGVVT